MGNCSLTSFPGDNNNSYSSIRVLTDSGSILELKPPKLAHEVLKSYPGHGIFRRAHGADPLSGDERLYGGKFYFLLPLECEKPKTEAERGKECGLALEVLPSGGDGVWRVKLMIDTKLLEEILSEQGNTEALIERMRLAASSGPTMASPRHGKSGNWKLNLLSLFSKVASDHYVVQRLVGIGNV